MFPRIALHQRFSFKLPRVPRVPIPYRCFTSFQPQTPTERQKENIYTIPNAITMARIACSPVIGYYITAHQYPLALSLLAVAAASDVVDGYIARRFNMKTHFGTVLDPAADKILMTVLTVSLCDAGLLSFPLAALIIGRDVGLVAGTMVYRYNSLPAPKTWSRYWDVSLPSAEVKPPLISKANTFLQLVLMYASLAAPVYGIPIDYVALEALRWTVTGTTICSGALYFFDKSLVRTL
ncbi:CDP-alcohol phosphatidyltransferase-domain-containing protein [Obelidium mucronatum]|nr:CDP-alcohol phosphatidyltransferase-domain-containing protein [Obelidium mucronatum]